MIDCADFILSKIDAGADDLEPVTIVQGNLRQWYDEIIRLRAAVDAERERCAEIVSLARFGEGDRDFRSIIHAIESQIPAAAYGTERDH